MLSGAVLNPDNAIPRWLSVCTGRAKVQRYFQNWSERFGKPRLPHWVAPKAACTVPAAPRPRFEWRDRALWLRRI